MPLYEFQCQENHITEEPVTSYDVLSIECPKCHKPALRLMGRQTTFLMDEEDRGGHA
jgi:hypothetical protein